MYKSLPRGKKERSKKRDQIIKECGITKAIFYNWLSGITYIDVRSMPTISKVVGVPTSELFPSVDTRFFKN